MPGSGQIIDFSKKNPNPPEGVTQQSNVIRLSGATQSSAPENPGPDPTQINVHPDTSVRLFERVVSDEDKLRAVVKRPNDPQVVVRDGDPKVDVSREDSEEW